jgi:hypothetical protein
MLVPVHGTLEGVHHPIATDRDFQADIPILENLTQVKYTKSSQSLS